MANEKTPVVWDDTTSKHRPLGTGEKMGGLDASSILSSDSGNLIQTGSDGLAYLSGGSIADPRADNLLEESANGKLQVTADRIVEWLGLNPSDAEKIAEALAAKMAGELADGQTITASGGKLHSDPTNATAAQKKAINQALADANSGLVVDNATGKLGVDFSQMPTDKFEALLKGLKMLVPLSANMNLYVDDDSDGDSLVDGRGTQAKPFKSIQAAVNYATRNYAIGPYQLTIYVKPGTYAPFICPDYSRTSGSAVVRAYDPSDRPVVVNTNPVSTTFGATGGLWYLYDFVIHNFVTDNGSSVPEYPNGIVSTGGSTELRLGNVDLLMSYSGSAPSHGITLRGVVATNGGVIRVIPKAEGPSSIEIHRGNASNAMAVSVETDSSFWFARSNIAVSGDTYKFYLSGETVNVFSISGGHVGWSGGELNAITMAVPSGADLTGRAYLVLNGGSMYMKSDSPVPGTSVTEGSVESASYSWYAVNPNL